MTNTEIIKFISKNKKYNNNINLYNNHLIKIFLNIIQDIITKFNKSNLLEYDIKYNINKNCKELNELNELNEYFISNKFVSKDVLSELQNNNINNIVINNKLYYLSLYYYDIDNIDEYLKNIIIIIHFINKINLYFNYDFIKFNVIIFLGNCKKYINFDEPIIHPINMNSGSCVPLDYLNVWRKEEYEKVLIHELLHFIKTDFFSHDAKNLENKIKKIILYENTNSINESYNETLAGILNMCYKSIKYSININKIYEFELNFLYIQTAKLILLFNGDSIKDLFDKKIIIKQTTSALSYIIFKMILFHHISKTLDFIQNINFKCNTEDKINKFGNLLFNCIQNTNYYEFVDNNINLIRNINFDNIIKKNLLMSII
jgi:hypothetical protein